MKNSSYKNTLCYEYKTLAVVEAASLCGPSPNLLGQYKNWSVTEVFILCGCWSPGL
jgi:hypothetical protein